MVQKKPEGLTEAYVQLLFPAKHLPLKNKLIYRVTRALMLFILLYLVTALVLKLFSNIQLFSLSDYWYQLIIILQAGNMYANSFAFNRMKNSWFGYFVIDKALAKRQSIALLVIAAFLLLLKFF